MSMNTEILIKGKQNFTLMASADNFLEINECGGKSTISISKDFSSIKKLESEIPQIRRSNSIIDFKYKGSVYVQFDTSTLMTVRWRELNIDNSVGVAYLVYEPANFRILTPSSES